jgi:hypothetical protein
MKSVRVGGHDSHIPPSQEPLAQLAAESVGEGRVRSCCFLAQDRGEDLDKRTVGFARVPSRGGDGLRRPEPLLRASCRVIGKNVDVVEAVGVIVRPAA